MRLSSEDKAVIKNDFEEKGWTAYTICKKHPTKNWVLKTVQRLVDKIKETGTVERRPGSGRPVTATTEANGDLVEQLICSQEEQPGTHKSPQEIAPLIGISRSSVKRLVKRRGYKQFKRMKTPRMTETTSQRRTERAGRLADRFESNPRLIEKCAFQDEKDFPLEVPLNPQNDRVYFKGDKKDVPEENLCHQSNRQSKKVMVSACLTWNGPTPPFFVNDSGMKVNAVFYKKHLEKKLIPSVEKLFSHKQWIFLQDSAPSHGSNLVQGYMNERLRKRFVKKTDWPPSSPDCNPLDFYFWDAVKAEVYRGRLNNPFENEEELKRKIKSVWKKVGSNREIIRKALKEFLPRARTVHENNGGCIKLFYS